MTTEPVPRDKRETPHPAMCTCDETDCHDCYPTLFTGFIDPDEAGDCTKCGDEESEHTYGIYCHPNRGLCTCGSGLQATRCGCSKSEAALQGLA